MYGEGVGRYHIDGGEENEVVGEGTDGWVDGGI